MEKSIWQILSQVILRHVFQFCFANTRPNVFGFSIDVCESRGFFSVIKTSSVITIYYASNLIVFNITKGHGTWNSAAKIPLPHCDLCFRKVISKQNKWAKLLLVCVGNI